VAGGNVITYKTLIDKYGEIQDEGIKDVLKAWFTSKDWEEPTPVSVSRVWEYIRRLESRCQ
jgi:hypothetical protein